MRAAPAGGRWVNLPVLQNAYFNGEEQPLTARLCAQVAIHGLRLYFSQADSLMRIRTKIRTWSYPEARYRLVVLGQNEPAPE